MATPTNAYRAMRKLWPHLPWSLRRRIGRRRAPSASLTPEASGLLGDGVPGDAVHRLRSDGYVVFAERVPSEVLDGLRRLAASAPARPSTTGETVVIGDPKGLAAPRYDLREQDLLADATVQGLLVGPSLRRLAEAYLEGLAVNDLAALWWSIAQPGGPSAAAAQQFHTDRDRLSFLKFFVYLTDVDEDHGPHVYVRGSHRRLPPALRADRRFSDDEVVAAFGPDALVSLTGPAGTVFAADTGGLHKGLAPRVGHRAVFQLEFATCLFGAPYVAARDTVLDPTARALAEACPRSYRRLLPA